MIYAHVVDANYTVNEHVPIRPTMGTIREKSNLFKNNFRRPLSSRGGGDIKALMVRTLLFFFAASLTYNGFQKRVLGREKKEEY